MKRFIILIICIIILSFAAACSTDSDKHEGTDETNTDESTSQVQTPDFHFTSMEEYVDYVLSESEGNSFSAGIMTYKIYASQEYLIYDYTYNEQYDDIAEIKQKLDESYDPNNKTAQHLLASLRSYVDIDCPKIKYIYRNNDGTVITEQIYE